MTNPMFNPQPSYSGVTIQIANPAVNVSQCDGRNPFGTGVNNCGVGVNNAGVGVNNGLNNGVNNLGLNNSYGVNNPYGVNVPAVQNYGQAQIPQAQSGMTSPMQNTGYPNAYPAQYYMNNYNYGGSNMDGVNNGGANNGGNNPSDGSNGVNGTESGNISDGAAVGTNNGANEVDAQNGLEEGVSNESQNSENVVNSYKMYAQGPEKKDNDMTKSQNIIEDLSEREAELAEEKKNTKETKIVALTDEYIKSLENYLDNPNDEIRLMASKEILTRLDEDKDRYDDAALNALLNKMMQDPNKLVRIAALSAFASQLASGNDYTVTLLHNIQSNPNSDKEDVLQAADILLKMSAGVEVKNIPNPSVKDKQE